MTPYDHRTMARQVVKGHAAAMLEFVILLGVVLGFLGVVSAALLAVAEATRDEAEHRIHH